MYDKQSWCCIWPTAFKAARVYPVSLLDMAQALQESRLCSSPHKCLRKLMTGKHPSDC